MGLQNRSGEMRKNSPPPGSNPRPAFLKLFSSGDHFYKSECSTDHPTLVPFESKLFEILNYSV
jgi:hypothetical protein